MLQKDIYYLYSSEIFTYLLIAIWQITSLRACMSKSLRTDFILQTLQGTCL